jgi:hypothetical protein
MLTYLTPLGNDVVYTKGNYGNSTEGPRVDISLSMPDASRTAVGIFMGLGGAVLLGLLGYFAWTWYKVRSSMVAGTPTKA